MLEQSTVIFIKKISPDAVGDQKMFTWSNYLKNGAYAANEISL